MAPSAGAFDTEISSEYIFSKLKHLEIWDNALLGQICRRSIRELRRTWLVVTEQGWRAKWFLVQRAR